MNEVVERIRTREFNTECPICYETKELNLIYPCCCNVVCFACYIKSAVANIESCPMCRQSFLPPCVIGISDTLAIQPKLDEVATLVNVLSSHRKTVILCEKLEYHYVVVPALVESGERVVRHASPDTFNEAQDGNDCHTYIVCDVVEMKRVYDELSAEACLVVIPPLMVDRLFCLFPKF